MTPEEIEDLLFAVDASRIGMDSARRIVALLAEQREACARAAAEFRGADQEHPEHDHVDSSCRWCIAAAIRALG